MAQIGAFTFSALTSQFGTAGKELWEASNGVGDRDRIPCAFTITGLPRQLEPGVPDWQQAVETFAALSRRLGSQRFGRLLDRYQSRIEWNGWP
mgnify:CR=1 FL=1